MLPYYFTTHEVVDVVASPSITTLEAATSNFKAP
jgi:hypothetical protein